MHYIIAHPVISVVVGFAVFNAAIQAMEAPGDKSGPGYRYVYRLGHLLAFNFQYALRSKFPDYVPPDGAAKP